ncbi:MAG TPA: hypothetical protein ENN69_08690, partial [Spirochaetia bacterium]|nr:hypothetical protein [Spirochaetia bacterium]
MAFKGFFNAAFVKDTLKTTAFSSVGRAIGFLIPFFIAAWFGTSPQTDAFFFIYGLVIFLSSIFASTVAAVIVPYIAEMLARRENPGRFISSLLQISTLLLTLLLGAAAVLLAGFFVFFNPFSPAVTAESILMLCELLPLVFLLVWTGILEGVLQADKKFSLPALSLILRAALTITLIWLFKPWLGIHAVITGYLAGEAARFLLLLIAAGRLRLFRFHCLRRPDGRVKDFLGKAAFQVVGVTAMGLNPVIDKLMAATLPMGSVSVLYYAERLFLIPVTFLVSGVLITLLSYWSGGLQTAGRTQLARDVSRTARWTVSPGLLVTVAVLLLAGPLAELAYGRGEMTAGTIH